MRSKEFEFVGRSVPRSEGVEKVTGRAVYTGDIILPGLLEARVLRSCFPHALIRRIDADAARALPGVCGVLTREDVRDIDPYYGHCLRDRPLIAMDRVRYVSEPVAAVAAEDAETAEEAVSLIQVDYEELPVVAEMDRALDSDAPVLHENVAAAGEYHELAAFEDNERSNICHTEQLEFGDILEGFAQSDRIFDDDFEFPMICHYTMEPHTVVARYREDTIAIWSSSAHPFLIRAELAHMFKVPLANVQVTIPYVGGAFGGKSYFKIEPLAVALARTARGRPVRLVQTASESMLTIRRHSARCHIKTGVSRDGTILARQAEVYLDTGAYADNGPRVAKRAATRIHGPYRIPHYRIHVSAVYTNTAPAGSMRSIGGPQAIWPLESHMDVIAAGIGMDPVEFRLKNLLRRGEELKSGAKPMDADLLMDLEKIASMIAWEKKPSGNGIGVGLAVGVTDSEAMPVSTAIARLLSDGTVVLMAGTTEVGQGARTVLRQIAAETLSLPLEKIVMWGTDTNVTPFDRSTGASRSTTVMGTAIKFAAEDLRGQLENIAVDLLGADTREIVLSDGHASANGRRLDYGALVQGFFGMPGGELVGRGYVRGGGGIPAEFPVFWETGMGAAEVAVDRETGALRLLRYVSLADLGRAINREQAEGQDEGAAMMGIGNTLYESLVYEDGQPVNPNLVDYRVPGFSSLPRKFDVYLMENADGPGPYGAKGMGESGIVAVAPAIGNALYRAAGVRLRMLPLSPEQVWRALQALDKGQKWGSTRKPR